MVYLITGKAGAGKSHYSRALAKELIDEGVRVVVLDGDEFRDKTGNQDFSDRGRLGNLLGAAHVAADLEKQGFVVVLAFIAPRKEWRDEMRSLWKESEVIYIPGGTLWAGTTYEKPTAPELREYNATRGAENQEKQ